MDPQAARSVLLSANASFYAHAAQALARGGLLQEFHTTYLRTRPLTSPRWPAPARRLADRVNAKRYLDCLEDVPLVQHPATEAVALLLTHVPRLTASSRYHLTNHLFDRAVRKSMRPSAAVHFSSGLGLLTARRAKQLGALVVCDRKATHHMHEQEVVQAEASRCGVEYRHPEGALFTRLEAEYAVADHLVVNSDYARGTFIERGFDARRVHVLRYGVDTSLFYPVETQSRGDAISLLFVGHLDARKGVRLLAEALPQFGRPYELLLAGSQAAYAIDLLTRAGVTFRTLGVKTKPQLRSLYNEVDLFVLPSVADAYGLVTLEAMACGTPVVVSDACGSAELLRHGENGFRFSAGDSHSLLSALHEAAVATRERRPAMGSTARAAATERTWAAYGQRVLELYDELL